MPHGQAAKVARQLGMPSSLSALLVIHATCGQPERPSLSLAAGDGGVRAIRFASGPAPSVPPGLARVAARHEGTISGRGGPAVGGLAQGPIKMPGIGEHRHHQRLGQGEPVQSLVFVAAAGGGQGTVQLAQEHDDGLFVHHGGLSVHSHHFTPTSPLDPASPSDVLHLAMLLLDAPRCDR
jgi:hypothetical protein